MRCELLPSWEGQGVGQYLEDALTHPWPLQGGEFTPGSFSISQDYKGFPQPLRLLDALIDFSPTPYFYHGYKERFIYGPASDSWACPFMDCGGLPPL